MNKVKLSQIIKDFIITSDGDDYANNVSDFAIRNFAKGYTGDWVRSR